jgi:hypothetical protein
MGFKPPVAVYDSCVLYPFEVRNLLVQFAFDRLVEARWTDEIHSEPDREHTGPVALAP